MTNNLFDFIKKYELEEYLKEFSEKDYKFVHLKKGEYLMMAGMEKRSLFFFFEGYVKVSSVSETGNETLLELLKPFEVFGDVEFIMESDISYNIYLKEDSTFLELPFSKIKRGSRMYELLAKRMAIKVQRTSKKYTERKLLDSKEIVSNFIIENKEYFSDKIVYNEFSKLVGLSERQLRRVLIELEEEGFIKRESKRIYINN